MKKIIIIIGTIAILASIIVVARMVDNRATLIQEIEEKTCKVVIKDIFNDARNSIINNIFIQVQNTGQVKVTTPDRTLILVPQ